MQVALLAVLGNRRALIATVIGICALAAVPATASAADVEIVSGNLKFNGFASSAPTTLRFLPPQGTNKSCCGQGNNYFIKNKSQVMSTTSPCVAQSSSSDYKGRVACPPAGVTKAQVMTGNGADDIYFGYEIYLYGDIQVPWSFGVRTSIWTGGGDDTATLPNPGLVDGGAGNDRIYTYGPSTLVYGNLGNDYISAVTAGADLNGGPGVDTIKAANNGGVDTIECADGDKIEADKVDKVYTAKGASCKLTRR